MSNKSRGTKGAFGNQRLTPLQRKQKAVTREAVKQIASLTNAGQLPLLAARNTSKVTL